MQVLWANHCENPRRNGKYKSKEQAGEDLGMKVMKEKEVERGTCGGNQKKGR